MTKPARIVAIEHVTLDGVYQAPARSDEDLRNGFQHGGWSAAADSPDMQTTISRYMTGGWSLLAGRTTYEDLYEGWHVRQPTSPMTKALTSVRKFVVTRNASYRLPWANSTLVAGEGADEVARLKEELETTLIIFGSGELVRSLMGEHLVDEFVLMIHPLILGEGRRLFDDDTPYAKLSIIEALPLDTGAIVALYRSAS